MTRKKLRCLGVLDVDQLLSNARIGHQLLNPFITECDGYFFSRRNEFVGALIKYPPRNLPAGFFCPVSRLRRNDGNSASYWGARSIRG